MSEVARRAHRVKVAHLARMNQGQAQDVVQMPLKSDTSDIGHRMVWWHSDAGAPAPAQSVSYRVRDGKQAEHPMGGKWIVQSRLSSFQPLLGRASMLGLGSPAASQPTFSDYSDEELGLSLPSCQSIFDVPARERSEDVLQQVGKDQQNGKKEGGGRHATTGICMSIHCPDDVDQEQDALAGCAVANFEAYCGMPPGSASLILVERSSAGIAGWAAAAPLPEAISGSSTGVAGGKRSLGTETASRKLPEESEPWEVVGEDATLQQTCDAKRPRVSDAEEEEALRRALLASVGVTLPPSEARGDEQGIALDTLSDSEEEDTELQEIEMATAAVAEAAPESGNSTTAPPSTAPVEATSEGRDPVRPPSVCRSSWQWREALIQLEKKLNDESNLHSTTQAVAVVAEHADEEWELVNP